MKKDQEGFGLLYSIVAAIVVVAIVVAGILVYNHDHKKINNSSTSSNSSISQQSANNGSSSSETQTAEPYSGWKSCIDNNESLSFKYPSTWSTINSTTKNPCTTSQAEAGEYFELTSPPSKSSPYIIQIQYSDNHQVSGPLDATKGQTILSVTPLTSSHSKKPLSLIAFADNSQGSNKVFEFSLTDQSYKAGQYVDHVPNVASQSGGGFYSMTAVLKEPSQQYIQSLPLSTYQDQPEYHNMLKIFQSLSY